MLSEKGHSKMNKSILIISMLIFTSLSAVPVSAEYDEDIVGYLWWDESTDVLMGNWATVDLEPGELYDIEWDLIFQTS